VKYVGNEKEQQQGGEQRKGLNQMDKTLVVSGARISYCIWEVQGMKNISYFNLMILRDNL
jgi:Rab family protein